jgi:hypothetical protein
LWHRRLGHPTSHIFNLLVFKNKIMCNNKYFWLKRGVIIDLLVSPQIFLLRRMEKGCFAATYFNQLVSPHTYGVVKKVFFIWMVMVAAFGVVRNITFIHLKVSTWSTTN